MPNYYFQILTPDNAIHLGTHPLHNSGSVFNGMLASLNATSGSMQLEATSPMGQFYDHMALEYTPTTEDLGTWIQGEYVNVVTGSYMALIGPDLFTAGAVPARGATLYPGTAGKIAVSGTNKIGKCLGSVTVQRSSGSFSAAQCQMDFTNIL